jgi:hypothetical protein
MRRWLAVFALLSLITTGFHSLATPAPAAAAGCYDTAYSHGDLILWDRQFTRWYYGMTTPNCTDLNISLTNRGLGDNQDCTVWVLAFWYSNAQQRWIMSTANWVPIRMIGSWTPTPPTPWVTPLKNVADGTRIAYIFYPTCSPSPGFGWYNTLWSAE